jgi:predicted RNA binding protein YcfA (HicA-like mRNA interferase family)
MPAKAKELERVAQRLGFEKARQKGSHARWKHPGSRATTIPIRLFAGCPEIILL